MNKKRITTEDVMKILFTPEEAQEVYQEAEQLINKWGGKRENSGRRTKTGTVLKLCVKVSEKEKEFLEYARSHNLDYDQLMRG